MDLIFVTARWSRPRPCYLTSVDCSLLSIRAFDTRQQEMTLVPVLALPRHVFGLKIRENSRSDPKPLSSAEPYLFPYHFPILFLFL